MTMIGAAIPLPLRMTDRTAYAQRVADSSNGRFTADQILAEEAESDRMKLKEAQAQENFLAGKGTYLGHSVGNRVVWKPGLDVQQREQARAARFEHYANMPGPISIEALNVDSAVTAQGTLTGGDLKNLSTYADYLRNEVAAASQVKPDATNFTGAWGKDRVTHDVNEYIGWLMQAAQQKSQAATEAG